MADPLPHSQEIVDNCHSYLGDASSILNNSFEKAKKSKVFTLVYRNSLALNAVFDGLANASWKPEPLGVKSIILRHPLLVSMGQLSLSEIELRRLMELSFWTVYFSSHPVEWGRYIKSPGDGFQPSTERPIQYCAHRPLKFYIDYAAELLEDEPSKLPLKSISELKSIISSKLNPTVHPSYLSVATSPHPPIEELSDTALTHFAELQKLVYSGVATVMAAVFREQFDKLSAMQRAYFDWLIGRANAKLLRASQFGLP